MRIGLIWVVLLLLPALVHASPACGSTLTTNVVMDADVSCPATAYTIGKHDITLNCNGHTISKSGAEYGAYYGITDAGYDRVTVENCNIENYTNRFTSQSHNSSIINSTFSASNMRTLQVLGSSGNLSISDSSFYSALNYSIYASTGYNLNLTNVSAYSWNTYGAYLATSHNAQLNNVSISSNRSYGLYGANSWNMIIRNSTIHSALQHALYLDRAHSLYMVNSTAQTYSNKYGMYLYRSVGASIDNSSMLSNSSAGLFNYYSNNTVIANSFAYSNASYGLYVRRSRDVLFQGSTALSIRSYGAYIGRSSDTGVNIVKNFTAINSTFSNQVGNRGMYMIRANNSLLINVSLIANNSYGLQASFADYLQLINSTTISHTTYTAYIADTLYMHTFNTSFITIGNGLGVYLLRSHYSTLTNTSFITPMNRRESLRIFQSQNNTIANSTVSRSINTHCNSFNTVVINSTVNRSDLEFFISSCGFGNNAQDITFKWYYNFSISTTNGTPASGAAINATAYLQKEGSLPIVLQEFYDTADSQGNWNGLAELTEFMANGVFKYNSTEYSQQNLTTYNNHTFTVILAGWSDNVTNATVNESVTPDQKTLMPQIPIIINVSITNSPPLFIDTSNSTQPVAYVTNLLGPLCPCGVNFTYIYPNGTAAYINQANISNSSNFYYGKNSTRPVVGIYTINVSAWNQQTTVTANGTFEVVAQAHISTCNYVTQPYQYYIVDLTACPPDTDGIWVNDGVRLDFDGELFGFVFAGTPRGLIINGTNITILGAGHSVVAFNRNIEIEGHSNTTIDNLLLVDSRSDSTLYINNSNGIYIANSTDMSNSPPATQPTIYIGSSSNITLDTVTGTPSSSATNYLYVENSTGITVRSFRKDIATNINTWFSFVDTSYIWLEYLQVKAPTTTTVYQYVKCERCTYFSIMSSNFTNSTNSINLVDSNHSREIYMYIPSTGGGPAIALPVYTKPVILSEVLAAGLLLNSSYNNSFYQITVPLARLSPYPVFIVNSTLVRLINLTESPTQFIPGSAGIYYNGSMNISIINSSIRNTNPGLGLFPYSEIREAINPASTGGVAIYLDNTTFNAANTSLTTPGAYVHVGWEVEFSVYSESGNTTTNLNITNSTGSRILNYSGTINSTWTVIVPQGLYNESCKPNMCLNETPTFFNASAKYSTENSTVATLTSPLLINLTLNYYPSTSCGIIGENTTLTQDIEIDLDTKVCYRFIREVYLFCDGHKIISTVPGQTAINFTKVGGVAQDCIINSTTGSYLAGIHFSSTGSRATNITFASAGNISLFTNSNNQLDNSGGTVVLGESDKAIAALYQAGIISNNNLLNLTFTGLGSGSLIYQQIPLGIPFLPVFNVDNAIFETSDGKTLVLNINNGFGYNIFTNTWLLTNNAPTDEAIFIEDTGGTFLLQHSTIRKATNFLRIGESTSVIFGNVSSDVTEIVIGTQSSLTNQYQQVALVQYQNATPCFGCQVNITDAQDNLVFGGTTNESGHLVLPPLYEYTMTGGNDVSDLFILNHSDQYNLSSDGELLYNTPHNFTAWITGARTYYGYNETWINESNTIVIVLIDTAPNGLLISPPDKSVIQPDEIHFVYRPIDDGFIVNSSLWINLTNGTLELLLVNDTPVTNDSLNEFIYTLSENGVYEWNVLVCDESDQCAFISSDYIFTIGNCTANPMSDDDFLLVLGVIAAFVIVVERKRRNKAKEDKEVVKDVARWNSDIHSGTESNQA